MAKSLSQREKYALTSAAGFILIFIVFQFVVFPALDKKERLHRMLLVKSRTLEELIGLQSKYEELVRKSQVAKQRLLKREKNFCRANLPS